VPILERNGLLTEADGDTLAEYCQLQSLNLHVTRALKRCKNKVLTEKHTVDGAGNEILEVKTNPLVTQKLNIASKLLPYLREFGMSPASRTRIQVAGGGDKDEFFGN
jgi:P27 family predicted phage terminase small subunit